MMRRGGEIDDSVEGPWESEGGIQVASLLWPVWTLVQQWVFAWFCQLFLWLVWSVLLDSIAWTRAGKVHLHWGRGHSSRELAMGWERVEMDWVFGKLTNGVTEFEGVGEDHEQVGSQSKESIWLGYCKQFQKVSPKSSWWETGRQGIETGAERFIEVYILFPMQRKKKECVCGGSVWHGWHGFEPNTKVKSGLDKPSKQSQNP